MHFLLSSDWGMEVMRDYIEALSQDPNLAEIIFPYETEHVVTNFTKPVIDNEQLKKLGLFDPSPKTRSKDYTRSEIKDYIIETFEEMVETMNAVNFEGSNSWVIGGKHTKTGKPIISSDPHLGNGIPSVWYFSHVELRDPKITENLRELDFNFIAGAGLPGCPIHSFYTTKHIAVSITSAVADSIDLYKEKIVENSYEFEGELLPLKFRTEIINIRGKEPVKLIVRSTHHGPLISNHFTGLKDLSAFAGPILPTYTGNSKVFAFLSLIFILFSCNLIKCAHIHVYDSA